MINKIHVYNNKTKRIVKTIDKDELIHNEELKHNLRENYLNKDCLELVCGCNKDIKLNIDKSDRLYHKKKSDIHKHNKFCFKHPDYDKTYKIKGWNETDKYIYARVNTFNREDKKSIELYDFLRMFNIYSWNTYVYKKNYSYINKFDFLKRLFGISNKIKLENFDNKTLHDLYFNISDLKNMKHKEVRFTYMYLKKFEFNKDKNTVSILGEYSKEKVFSFEVDKKIFNKRYFKIKNDGINGNIAFSGFLVKEKDVFRLVDFELLRVDSKGLFCNNKYEVSLFNMLSKNNIPIIKPYRPIPIYDGHMPTAIVFEKNKNREVFIEIFLNDDDKSLKLRKNKVNKIDNVLKYTHKLIAWDVYKSNDLPSMDFINSVLKN